MINPLLITFAIAAPLSQAIFKIQNSGKDIRTPAAACGLLSALAFSCLQSSVYAPIRYTLIICNIVCLVSTRKTVPAPAPPAPRPAPPAPMPAPPAPVPAPPAPVPAPPAPMPAPPAPAPIPAPPAPIPAPVPAPIPAPVPAPPAGLPNLETSSMEEDLEFFVAASNDDTFDSRAAILRKYSDPNISKPRCNFFVTEILSRTNFDSPLYYLLSEIHRGNFSVEELYSIFDSLHNRAISGITISFDVFQAIGADPKCQDALATEMIQSQIREITTDLNHRNTQP